MTPFVAQSVLPNSALLRIVLPGGNGQIGRLLARRFHSQGHMVTVLARKSEIAPWPVIPWDGAALGDWVREIESADVVINLAGRSVNCRYTEANKKEILESRTRTTRLIGQAIASSVRPPRLWLNMSTATIYRHIFDLPMDEATGELGGHEPDAPAAWRFSIQVATEWEDAFFSAPTPGTRRVALRAAMVMSPDRGGIFDTLLRLVRFGLGGTSGSGRQYISWVHDSDFLRSIEFLINCEDFTGPVNISSPNPLPNREFMAILRRAWGAAIGLPATEWMLALGAILLRTETELILKSRRVIPGRLSSAGFQFQFPDWESASRDLVDRWRAPSHFGEKQ